MPLIKLPVAARADNVGGASRARTECREGTAVSHERLMQSTVAAPDKAGCKQLEYQLQRVNGRFIHGRRGTAVIRGAAVTPADERRHAPSIIREHTPMYLPRQ